MAGFIDWILSSSSGCEMGMQILLVFVVFERYNRYSRLIGKEGLSTGYAACGRAVTVRYSGIGLRGGSTVQLAVCQDVYCTCCEILAWL